MRTITKRNLIERVAEATGHRRADVKRTISAFLDVMVEELARGNRIEFREFGVFEAKERASRTAQNPKTLERVVVPARRTVKFKPGRQVRDRLELPLPGTTAPAASSQPPASPGPASPQPAVAAHNGTAAAAKPAAASRRGRTNNGARRDNGNVRIEAKPAQSATSV